MAVGDLHSRTGGAIGGSKRHTGTGAEVIARIPIESGDRQYSFVFVGKTMKEGGTGGATGNYLQQMHLIAVSSEGAIRASQVGADNGALTGPTWSFAKNTVDGVLYVEASCTDATNGSDAVSCGFFVGLGFEATTGAA